jgi:excisionase family DNA binding protein
MTNDENNVTDLERERRIQRKVRELGEQIEAAGEGDDFEDNPEGYLKRKAEDVPDDDPKLYSVREVAELFDVDPESVRRWIRRGDLDASKVGRGYRISRPDLRDYYQQKGGSQLFDETPDDEEETDANP